MEFLKALGINAINPGVSTGNTWIKTKGEKISSFSPVDGKLIGSVIAADWTAYETVVKKAEQAFIEWRSWPAPKRGEVVRQVGEELRKYKIRPG
jgi:aldehyde dehydrogenase (NAD+)